MSVHPWVRLAGRIAMLLVAVFVSAGSLAGCGKSPGPEQETAARTLTATIGFPEPHALFAPGGGGGGPAFTGSKVLERLARYNKDQSFSPVLAESWAFSDDGRRLVIKVRQGVKWHDGKPLSAEDVAWSIGEYWKPFQPQSVLDFLETAEVTAPDEVTLVFSRPVPRFSVEWLLANGANYILPKHVYAGTDILLNPANNAPIGTGPWRFSQWVRGSHAEFVKNADYWVEGQPRLDKLIIRWWREPASRAAAFETGQVDIGVSNPVPLGDIKRLQASPNLVIRFETDATPLGLHFNVKGPVTSDVRVRRALLHAVDRQFIADTIYYGLAKPAVGPILSSNTLYFNPDLPSYPFDPKKAEALLDEAGYPRKADGKRFRLNLLASGWSEENGKTGAYLKQAFEDIGIDVALRIPDRPNSLKALYTDYDFDVAYSQGGGTNADPVPELAQVFTTSGIRKGLIFRNASRYSNPVLDTLVDRIKVETDPETRKALIHEFARLVMTDVPLVAQIEWPTHTVLQKNVHTTSTAHSFGGDSWADVWKD